MAGNVSRFAPKHLAIIGFAPRKPESRVAGNFAHTGVPAGFLSEGFPKSRRGMGLVYHTRNLDKVEFQPPHCIAVVGVMATDHFIKLFFVMIKYPMNPTAQRPHCDLKTAPFEPCQKTASQAFRSSCARIYEMVI
jgi:hypothetical protein